MPEFTPDEYDDAVFPDEYRGKREKHKLEGAVQPDGALHFNGKTPFILSQEPWRTPKKKKAKDDVLSVTMDETWSQMRTEALGRPVYYFQVYNETKAHGYTTELFEGIRGEPCANCNCPAAVVCKHIISCLIKVLKDVNPEFGSSERDSEFMATLGLEHKL